MLSRRFGGVHLEAIEDAVQGALLSAVEQWSRGGPPEDPAAWVYRVALNRFLDELRKGANRERLLEKHSADLGHAEEGGGAGHVGYLRGEVPDDFLRLLFVCCEPETPLESQLVFALKTVSGFSVPEIAQRLFTTDGNVNKRLSRARRRLRETPDLPGELSAEACRGRIASVRGVLYLMFTEGHLAPVEPSIRTELCAEALRLTLILAQHPMGQQPETYALLALMYLHAARLASRADSGGGLLLLEEQERAKWDRQQIQLGLYWLERSAMGPVFSRYHAEAGVAAEHCLAPSYSATRWDRVVACYECLDQSVSPGMHRLNLALALAELRGPRAGLSLLENWQAPSWLARSFSWALGLADLHQRCGNETQALAWQQLAIERAPSVSVERWVRRRIELNQRRQPAGS